MNVVVVGAGKVGEMAVESLHEDHDCTVIDVDPARLEAIANSFDVRVVEGNGTRRDALVEAGVEHAGLVLACTARGEGNLVTAMLVRRLSEARTVVRTSDIADLDAWRDGDLDVDLMVSSELETANAVARVVAVPGAHQADFFLDGQVQILEFDVARVEPQEFCGRPLAAAGLPPQSRVVGILRDGEHVVPSPDERLLPGDRVIVVASPSAARDWSRLLVRGERVVRSVALFGGNRLGETIARVLLDREISVSLIEADARRADELAAALPDARVYESTGFDPAFLRREHIGRVSAAVFALRDDAASLFGAVVAKVHGVPSTIAVLERATAREAFDAAGVDAAIDPGAETAQVMVRFAHDPRTRQVAILEDDRFEVLDIAVRPQSPLAGRASGALTSTASMVGAIVRDGRLVFPSGDEALRVGDRVIVLAERERVGEIDRAL